MKAILIIDIPDTVDLNKVNVDVALYDGGVDGTAFHPLYVQGKLKSMPEEQHAQWIWGDDCYHKGWNDCLKEIQK